MTAAVKKERELSLFVRREIDDYGLDLCKFRLYVQITRRAIAKQADIALLAWNNYKTLSRASLVLLKITLLIKINKQQEIAT